ncbi:MurR/RpiR family transcriptional regulator [Epibacterium ulvae]|uniref:MurR/RpiR family transcriptional regulator n=1 Tax=Epibacterium ulvae TaxID=1156985 RepID=UPI001BFCC292|nr:MurR/RpiR family transcriptional regulator [Epibacterium ulvae]MBT8154126.1 MurR/RpiR family transcriptional regulator [Epibacterium ulvae]
MNIETRIEDVVSERYTDLSQTLRAAADFVVANQMDIATRSLRSVSSSSGVSPAAFSRLARALGFDVYEDLREACRHGLWDRGASFAERAERLSDATQDSDTILNRHSSACMNNISEMAGCISPNRLGAAVDALQSARNVVLFGAFSSTGIVEYMAYLAQYFASNWTLAGRMGASLGSALAGLGAEDVLLIVTKTPYARRAVLAAEMAQKAAPQVIVITDSHACPAIQYANFPFIIPSDSPQFFSSYAATIALMETMVAMVVAQTGEAATNRISEVEGQNRRLGEFWTD